MTPPTSAFQSDDPAALRELFAAVCDETATPDQFQIFEETLRNDTEAMDGFARFVQVHVLLQRKFAPIHPSVGDDGFERHSPAAEAPATTAKPIVPALLGNAGYGTVGDFCSGWPVAYLVATVTLAIGLVIGAVTHVSQPGTFVRKPPTAAKDQNPNAQTPADRNGPIVGRITGVVDCVCEGWDASNQKSEIGNQKSPIRLGDRLALRSGLLEITYDMGARVLLQGPVTYKVESPAGGYLSIGKLTATLEKGSGIYANPKRQRGSEGEDSGNRKSPHLGPLTSNLFAIRTPTAIVTDLGTEFGLEVDKTGCTTSHVFRGVVEMRPILADRNVTGQGIVLLKGDAARIEPLDAGHPSVPTRVTGKSDGFIRQMPLPVKRLPLHVLAWFRLGEDDAGAAAGQAVGEKTVRHKGGQDLARRGAPSYSSETAASDSSLSVRFGGGADECLVSPRILCTINDYFVLEAWCRLNDDGRRGQYVVYSGNPRDDGYGIMAKNGTWHIVLGGIVDKDSGIRCQRNQWTHVALVCERGVLQFWLNGRPEGTPFIGVPKVPEGPFAIGGDHTNPPLSISGLIDEVRLSSFLAPFDPKMLLMPSVAH